MENTEKEVGKKKSSWRKRILYALLFVLLFPILIFLLLQVGFIQNAAVNYVTKRISKSIDGDVSIGHIDLSLTDGLKLEDFNLSEADGDTIVHATSLNISLVRNLFSLVDKNLSVNRLELNEPVIRIVKEKGNNTDNLSLVVNKLFKSSSPRDSSSKKFDLDINSIRLNDLSFTLIDENEDLKQTITLKKGSIDINVFLEDDIFEIERLNFEEPIVRMAKYSEGVIVETQGEDVVAIRDSIESDTSGIVVLIGDFTIKNGLFAYNDYTKEELGLPDVLDRSHFEFRDINLNISDFRFADGDDFIMNIDNFGFVDNIGFEVKSLSSKDVRINSETISFPDFELITEKTTLKESISLSYESFDDFKDLEEKVIFSAQFTDSYVHLGDIMHFVQSLNDKGFFADNKHRTIALSGVINGTLDRLSGNDMQIRIGNDFSLNANITTRNINSKGNELLNVSVKRLETNMSFLRAFIPGFNPPQNFNKLGNVTFKGRFDGYPKDFVAFGSLNSSLGKAFLDMRLDVKGGNSNAAYSGEMNLEQFDLGAWTDNDDFGMVDFTASIQDGKGLTLNSLYTELFAVVELLEYKGYQYRDFEMDAQMNKNKFNGEFSITDENIDLIFDGNVEIIDSVPHLDFKANIANIDFQKLNLSPDPYRIKGNVDLNAIGNTIDDVVGSLIASEIEVIANDTLYQLDTISLITRDLLDGKRKINLYTDVARAELEGKFKVEEVVPGMQYLLKKNYPHYTQSWDIEEGELSEQNLTFDIDIYDSRNFLDLVGLKNFGTRKFKAKGSLNTKEGDLSFASTVPWIRIDNNSFWDVQLLMSSNSNGGDILLNVDSTVIGSKSFNPIDIQSRMQGDTVQFFVSTTEIVDSLESLDIKGQLIPHPKGYEVSITDNQIDALGGNWSFESGNKIIFGKDYHEISNLIISDGYRRIQIDDVDNKGISLDLLSFNLLTLNDFINYNKMDFGGEGNVGVTVDNIYSEKNIQAYANFEEFTINGDDFGALNLDASKTNEKPIEALLSIGEGGRELIIEATYDLDEKYLDAEAKGRDFPVKIFEYLLKDGIKNTYGGLSLQAKIFGPIDDLKMDGGGNLTGGVTIVYTGVEYTIDNQPVKLSETAIDLTGVEIKDPHGGIGTITGGLFHNVFRDFGVDAVIQGDNVIALNTTKADNPVYYGFGKGDITASFEGPFHLVNMRFNATTREGTVVNIPIWEGETSSDQNFIEFTTKEDFLDEDSRQDRDFRFEGIDIEMNVTMTPAAQVNIIFDESRGDIIKGNGRGNFKMNITRYGDFDMYGTYEIEQGQYLFTALGAVAKPFEVRRGGQIRWTGDPINAELDIEADYEVRTNMEVFLSEFVQEGTPLETASRSTTKVELILNLGGTLYNPQVNFDLGFPDLDGELRTTADSKMRTLRANQAELNSQVLGLIVFNSFLPTSGIQSVNATANIGNTGISTLSEFVSSQLSILFTGLLNEALTDDGLISGIDFDIGFRKNSFYGVQTNNSDILPDEIEVHLKNRFRFLDERFSVDLGGNYVRDNIVFGGDYFIGDFVLEYYLTDDRKLKLQMYGRYDYDEYFLERRQKYGVGIGYRTESGSLIDFSQTVAEQFREAENKVEQ